MEPGGSPPPVPAASGTGWVLVCDDTASIRLLIRINLELEGFEVLEAADGQAGVALLHRHLDALPAAVVLDVQMAPGDGWGAIAAIRGDPRLTHLPVVLVTASLQQQERERAAAAGADGFVPKPFEPEELVELIRDLATNGRGGAKP